MRNWIRHVDGLIGNLIVFNWVHGLAKTASQWSDAELAERLKKIPSKERQEAWIRAARKPYTEEERAAARAQAGGTAGPHGSDADASGWLAGGRYSIADIAAGAVRQAHRGGNRARRGDAGQASARHRVVEGDPGAARLRAREHRAVRGRLKAGASQVRIAARRASWQPLVRQLPSGWRCMG